jgi:crossover junction endodeoxyribonuclease RuvC
LSGSSSREAAPLRRILGIDPGLRSTGFGIITVAGNTLTYVTCGCITSGERELPARLSVILRDLGAVIVLHRPTEVAIEKVFVNVNPQSTLLLGQARGAAISAAVLAELPVAEYTALQVKQAVVGHGKAAKEQVQDMVRRLLKLPGALARRADALACAIARTAVRVSRTSLRLPSPSRAHRLMRAPRPPRRPERDIRHGWTAARHRAAGRARRAEAASALGVEFDMALALAMVGRNFPIARRWCAHATGAGYPVDALLGRWHANTTPSSSATASCSNRVSELIDWLDVHAIPRAVATSSRASARAKTPARTCCRASSISSAATRWRKASRRPTSTSKPRGVSPSAPATAWRSKTRSPAFERRTPPG